MHAAGHRPIDVTRVAEGAVIASAEVQLLGESPRSVNAWAGVTQPFTNLVTRDCMPWSGYAKVRVVLYSN